MLPGQHGSYSQSGTLRENPRASLQFGHMSNLTGHFTAGNEVFF